MAHVVRIEKTKEQKEAEEKPVTHMTPEETTAHETYAQWITAASEAKKPIEWEWFVRKNFIDGNQWVRWNTDTKTLETVDPQNKFKVTINKIYTIVRAIRNYTLKHQPKWEVMAQDLEKKIYNKAVASERFLDLFYLEDDSSGKTFKVKVKEAVGDAIWASVGHIWFWWDSTKKWLMSKAVSPFDLLPDPTCTDSVAYTDAKFVFMAESVKTDDIKNDKRYMHTEDVISDNKLAASDLKVTLMKMTSGLNVEGWNAQKDLNTTIRYEGYVKQEEKNSKGGMYKHVVLTATVLLVDEDTDFTDMPVRTYHTDVETNRQYTQGWVKNLIPAQKILNVNESNALEFNHVISRGRFVADKGAGAGIVYNRNGQVIEKNRGYAFQQMPMQSQPVTVENQITRASRYMEDMGAAHDAFVGRMPSGANSGVAIENLLAGEENNLTDLRDNLSDFYTSTAKFILKVFSKKLMSVMVFFTPLPDKEVPDFNALVGQKSPVSIQKQEITYSGKKQNVTVDRILENNNIRVTIGTWLGTGKQDSRTEAIELAKNGLLDKQTLLEFFNAPNIPRIIDRVNKEAAAKAAMQAAVSQPPGTMPAIDMPGGMGGGGPQPTTGVTPALPMSGQ